MGNIDAYLLSFCDAHDVTLYALYGLCTLVLCLFGMEQIHDGGDDGEEECNNGKNSGEEGKVSTFLWVEPRRPRKDKGGTTGNDDVKGHVPYDNRHHLPSRVLVFR